MKKLFMLLAALTCGGSALAQNDNNVVLKAGTIIPMQSVATVKAADVEEGETVDFRVIQDISVDGVCIVPGGSLAKGKVTLAEKSSLAGTKGRLYITISHLTLPSGEPIYFTSSDIRITGKNRTPLSVVCAIFVWPCIFIPGTKAVMPEGYEVQATVATNTTIKY